MKEIIKLIRVIVALPFLLMTAITFGILKLLIGEEMKEVMRRDLRAMGASGIYRKMFNEDEQEEHEEVVENLRQQQKERNEREDEI